MVSGGRTGLTAFTTAILFLLMLFFSPLVAMIPNFATAPALFFVAVLMIASIKNIDWNNLSETAPVVITSVMMPLTFSIAEGIAMGFIAYTLIKLFSGKAKDLNTSVYLISLLFLAKYFFLN